MPEKSESRPLTSIVSYPERGEGGNNRYRGNCSPKLVEDLLGFFRPQEVCDYMCGSGTTKAAADRLGISSHLYDLHSGFDIMSCEIPALQYAGRDREARDAGEHYYQGAAQLLFGQNQVQRFFHTDSA